MKGDAIMTDNELLLSISEMLDKKLDAHTEVIDKKLDEHTKEIKAEVRKIENSVLEEVDRVDEKLQKKIDGLSEVVKEIKEYYRINKSENDNWLKERSRYFKKQNSLKAIHNVQKESSSELSFFVCSKNIGVDLFYHFVSILS